MLTVCFSWCYRCGGFEWIRCLWSQYGSRIASHWRRRCPAPRCSWWIPIPLTGSRRQAAFGMQALDLSKIDGSRSPTWSPVGERRTNPGAGGQSCLVTPAPKGEAKSAVVSEQKTLSGLKLSERSLFSVMFQGTDLAVVIWSLFSRLGIEPTTNYLLTKAIPVLWYR